MDLFLLRHGSAHPDAPKDSERALNAPGREEVARIMAANQAYLRGVSHVLVSPYRRAQQTCEIALNYLDANARERCEIVDFLTPCGNPQNLLDELLQRAYPSVLCVSHQPLLGTVLDEACGFDPGQYRLATGALAHIHFADLVAKGLGSLLWLRQP